ncbi:MAG TPA: DUF6159 family protein [Ferruginibacter sp.]|jgi:hypothetical protein|nr:DUF6159 family protein [Ferruginibacter sp.]
MGFSERLSNGWTIMQNSFKVLKENKQLIIFPILSGISIILILGSFGIAVFANAGWDATNIIQPDRLGAYAILIMFYTINYFIVVFFNTALVHCTTAYFKGEEVSIKSGLLFSLSRIGVIFSWAIFAGTIGALLKIIQENVGTLGRIITGLVGIVWGVATFFVVPVIANENLGPIDAFKRSSQLMKEKWGQSIGAGFTVGLIQTCFLLVAIVPAVLIGTFINFFAGIAFGIITISAILAVFGAARTIFITAIYLNITGDPVENYNQQFVDNLFVEKNRKLI